MEILVIEDEKAIRNLITTTLELNDYNFHIAVNGNEGIEKLRNNNISMILLDLGLPDIDGIEVVRKVREFSDVPIIVISARMEDQDKIEALDVGADDYLTKPFSVGELLARIRALSRRKDSSNTEKEAEFINDNLRIDYLNGLVMVNDIEIHVTPIEYKLLKILSKNINKVLSYNFILKEVWGSEFIDDTKSLRVFMANLRKKLEVAGFDKEHIQTHVGVGYRMLKN